MPDWLWKILVIGMLGLGFFIFYGIFSNLP